MSIKGIIITIINIIIIIAIIIRITLLENEQYSTMHYTLPSKPNMNTNAKSISLSIAMMKDRKGLLFKIRDNEMTSSSSSTTSSKEDKDIPSSSLKKKKLDIIESSINGRLILLTDIGEIKTNTSRNSYTNKNSDSNRNSDSNSNSSKYQEVDHNSIHFSLITKEGEIHLEMSKGGIGNTTKC